MHNARNFEDGQSDGRAQMRIKVDQCRVFFSLLLALTMAGRLVFAADTATQAGGAEVVSIEGRAQFSRRAAPQWQTATNGLRLANGDLFRTMARSRATLKWSDLSTLRVDELTTLEIRPPRPKARVADIDVKSGAGYFFSREKPAEIHFQTPVASGAIRGTEFNLRVAADGRTELTLLDGEVDLTNEFGGVALRAGEQATVEPGQAPRTTAVIDAVSIIQWALYYPAVLDPAELGLAAADAALLRESLDAYRAGDLIGALPGSCDMVRVVDWISSPAFTLVRVCDLLKVPPSCACARAFAFRFGPLP